jgi:hypothetical protein
MSFHESSETVLPNHWCAISCASVFTLTPLVTLLLGKWIFVCTSST